MSLDGVEKLVALLRLPDLLRGLGGHAQEPRY
jgi:hypothetical protein